MGQYNDLVGLGRAVVSLIREHELNKALDRVRTAQRYRVSIDYRTRAEGINRINQMIFGLKAYREELRKAIDSLPAKEQLFASAQIEPVLVSVYDSKIAELKAQKRKLSK